MGCRMRQALALVVGLISVAWLFAVPVHAAGIAGSNTGIFTNPAPAGAVVTGVGTSFFTWGTGMGIPPSSLRYTGVPFSAETEEVFQIGTLEYFNGTIVTGTEATSVDLTITVTFTVPDGFVEDFTQTLRLITTPNTDDPMASADRVFLPTTFPDRTFTVGGNEYTLIIIGFGTPSGGGFTTLDNFNLFEGDIASVGLFARVGRACKVPGGGEPIREEITNFGWCGLLDIGQKNPTWGSFGPKPGGVLEADSGERLEVECSGPAGYIPSFKMWYTSVEGKKYRVGFCPFEGGSNVPWFWHAGDNDGNGKPDCFIRTRWISKDYGNYDDRDPNPWTNVSEPFDEYIDWAETLFDVNSTKVSKNDYKWEKLTDYPISLPPPPFALLEGVLKNQITVDPLLGPETEAFFDEAEARLQLQPAGAPMGEDSSARCDFDGDGDCDYLDRTVFQAAIGSCRGDSNYHPLADSNGDGCVTPEDLVVIADLSVTQIDAPDPVTAGSPLTYTVIVTNAGPDPATSVTLTDTLPASVTFVSATPTQGSCLETTGVVTCALGNLDTGATATMTLIVTPTTAGALTNTAVVAGNESDPTPANNTAQAITTVNPANGPDLAGTWSSLSQSCRVKLGVQTCTLRGQLTVSNPGSAPVPAASVLRLYLSSDGTTPETLLTQVSVNALAVGRTQRARLRVPLPVGTTASGKYVMAVLDATGLIAERDETNNVVVVGPIP